MAKLTRHARERIDERLPKAFGLSVADLEARLAKVCESDAQVWIARLPQKVWVGESNGDGLCAIVRGGNVTTVFLRRTSQPTKLMPRVVWANS